jgi:phospholipid/cholesterol/gamma-HCH transport system substrate-binding protein
VSAPTPVERFSLGHRLRKQKPVFFVALFTAVSLMIWAALIFSLQDRNFRPTTTYKAMFTDASGLHAGDTVRVAGVIDGKVSRVRLRGYDVEVTFAVNHDQTITSTTHAAVRYANLLGQRYLALVPGDPAGTPLDKGATIGEANTSPALDLTALLNGFQPLFSALQPAQVNQLASSLVQVLQGEAGASTDLVTQLASVSTNLAQRQDAIGQVVDNLATVAQSVGAHDTDLDQAITQLQTVLAGTSASRADIGRSITVLGNLTSTVSNLFAQSQPALDEDLAGLHKVSDTIAANGDALNSTLAGLPGLLTYFARFVGSGSWLQVYICDLDVQVSGSAPAPLVPSIGLPVPLRFPSGPVGNPSLHTKSCS